MTKDKKTILIVDDEKDYCLSLKLILEKEGYIVQLAYTGEEAKEKIQENEYHLVITDVRMKEVSGLELLKYIRNEIAKPLEVIVVTAYGAIEQAVKAMKLGAFSYFVKTGNTDELILDVKKVLEIEKIKDQNKELKLKSMDNNYLLKTNNKKFKRTLLLAKKVAKTNTNVLIYGESGVGKEFFANLIHNNSNRVNGSFLPVNCHALPKNLLESELYGHEKGSFTGSIDSRKGRFEEAHNGTLFLDEIGDMPLEIQAKILRNIEEKRIQRIGSNKSIEVDFRLISATNKNLEDQIKQGQFREDLYYRINTVSIEIPPLRERKEDIELLAKFFICQIQNIQNHYIESIDPGIFSYLREYEFQGNVRELKNIIERLIIFNDDHQLTIDDLFEYGLENESNEIGDKKDNTLKVVKANAEKKHIIKMLAKTNSNLDETAKNLNISKRHLFTKLKTYEIDY